MSFLSVLSKQTQLTFILSTKCTNVIMVHTFCIPKEKYTISMQNTSKIIREPINIVCANPRVFANTNFLSITNTLNCPFSH
jgi:hypothetical protein